jgi:hypothetical protein
MDRFGREVTLKLNPRMITGASAQAFALAMLALIVASGCSAFKDECEEETPGSMTVYHADGTKACKYPSVDTEWPYPGE